MNFSNFLFMGQEIGLVILFLILFLYDTFCSEKGKKYFQSLAVALFAVLTFYGFWPFIAGSFNYWEGSAFGGLYITSPMIVLMKNILNVATWIVLLQSHKWLSSEGTAHKQGEFYTITFITLLGMYLMVSAGNFMMLYIGMETASLPLACLAAFNKCKEKSAEAGVKYILVSAFSSGIMLFGLSFLYGGLGTLYFTDAATRDITSPLVILGFVFFFGGLGFKLSLVPFHLWTADVYEGAPTSVTAYLSVVSKGAATFALILVLYKVFGSIEGIWHHILWGLSVVTITLGNLFAIRQTDMKRFFAFSSISQAGYILLGIIAGTAHGMTTTVYYILVYLFSNLAAFGVIAAVEQQANGDSRISAINGLYKSSPLLAVVMMLAVFSLGGIPPFAGFFSKFLIFTAAYAQGNYILVFIALLNTVISLYYYLLIVKAMFICEKEEDTVVKFKTDSYNRISLFICVAGIFVVGILSCIYEYIGTLSFGI
ncbi:MAG: NADH-quinone oxidoreductase subunit N [Dysgonamonadaceae bacterium]|jgi:NADH-quinone oxidoreductase subunit N|nr:NADH-quinone oxidoreductase subunit N [Dysgonamonadaceae bacterium]